MTNMQIQEILNNPPQDLLVEIGKEIATDRMRDDSEMGNIIRIAATREQTREIVNGLWDEDNETSERQRKKYSQDARTAIRVIASYLKENAKPFRPLEVNGKWCRICSWLSMRLS